MECRTPLTIQAPRPVITQPQVPSYRARGRSTSLRHRYEIPRQAPIPPKRFPLPKNIVLITLIEAATDITGSHHNPSSPSSIGPSISRQESEDTAEEAKIRFSTSLAISACGTYIVKEAEGVHIFPSKPIDIDGEQACASPKCSESEDVDAMVRFFHLDHKLVLSSPGAPSTDLPPVDLSKGDRIQIVSIDDGWAKLARGYGYVRCRNGEIAKVGGSIDRACKLEALLRSISIRRKELRTEQRKLDNRFVSFMKDLQNSLLNDEDFTVIGVEAYAEVDKECSSDSDDSVGNNEASSIVAAGTLKLPPPSSPRSRHTNKVTYARLPIESESKQGSPILARIQKPAPVSNPDLSKPQPLVRTYTPRESLVSNLTCFIGGLSFSDEPNSFEEMEDSAGTAILGSCSGGSNGTWSCEESRTPDDSHSNTSDRRNNSIRNQPSPRGKLFGTQACRERNSRPDSQGINFRSGMSGHMALLSTKAHQIENSPQPYMRSPGRISCHSGLTLPRRMDAPGVASMPSYSRSSFDTDDNLTI
eukprot:CAMPEP_0194130848 /NCGR_PEP_ID=MMETSP0152-20130528/1775_1 /TAXON_ID=1049557 /ORGANISM="Thalassiothrix antarctica, Strain L6-D1" /LENGTH=530 /DNA_ID=CAMNT_0038825465 /DNA_START=185 /DNA_END=1777 /DNA_ORIENTATION=-